MCVRVCVCGACMCVWAFVRSWGLELDQAERCNVIRYAWQQYSTVLQSGNAEVILSANG